ESKFSIDGQRAKDVCFHSVALARRLATDGFVQASQECFSGQEGHLRLQQGETARDRAKCKNDEGRRDQSDSSRLRWPSHAGESSKTPFELLPPLLASVVGRCEPGVQPFQKHLVSRSNPTLRRVARIFRPAFS